MKLGEIIRTLEEIAPPRLVKAGDRIGLQIGDPEQEVRRIIVTVDVTPEVVNEAIRTSADLIVAHHPLIYDPLPTVRLDVYPQSLVYALIHAGCALWVMHTNYDAAEGGINDVLAEKLGVIDTKTADLTYTEKLFKLAVFVPAEALEAVKEALAEAGAGAIGDYSHCSFETPGTGSFKPLVGSRPYIGSVGEIEHVAEFRLEVIVPEESLGGAINAMKRAHPYEEAAYDVYPLRNTGESMGLLKYGVLRSPMSFSGLCEMVCDVLEFEDVRFAGNPDARIEKVAILGGGGGTRVPLAHSLGVDAFITGDVNHHQFLHAKAVGLNIIDATHFHTEKPGMAALAPRLQDILTDQGVTVEYADDYTIAGGG